ncbi:GLPGLI family protein [Algoriphagus ornithinivorans]|uniref:GLPGLI family protein n=1 Tax=Algoriphagus ornithinivorans TaxID=226506 RepID=A0A1I5IN06_9BACT|nr:GLPGLI family protein [Algoriphagus ornithinivorans]SFO61670.1 GLPGLI family protein [Algoriphagus ornithinivorans]
MIKAFKQSIVHSWLILSISLFLQTQAVGQKMNFAFLYEMEYARDKSDLTQKEKELMVLWVNSNKSLFQSYNGYLRDSVYHSYLNIASQIDKLGKQAGSVDINQMLQQMGQFPTAKNTYKILKSSNDQKILQYRKLFKTDYYFSESIANLNWVIKEDTKDIFGYTCNLALLDYSGRKFFAWFTPEIPFNDGPYIFGGLPGLILELYDSDCEYIFKLVGIEKRTIEFETLYPKNAKKIGRAQYFKLEDEYRENPFSQMSELDASRVSPSDAAEVQRKLKSFNNRLERVID